LAQIEAEKERIEMVRARLEANIIVPAQATQEKLVEDAKAQSASIRGEGQAELNQLTKTIEILQAGDQQGVTAYLIEKFDELVGSFAGTMDLFPVDQISVISGAKPEGPISAIHPNAVDAGVNRYIAEIIGGRRAGSKPEAAVEEAV
jgi:hypothetical protein